MWLFETTDYEITLLKYPQDTKSMFQREVLQLVFESRVVPGAKRKLSDIKTDQPHLRRNALLITQLKKAAVKDLVEQDLLEQIITRSARYVIVFVVVWIGFFLSGLLNQVAGLHGYVLLAAIGVTLGLFLIFATERRTRKGYEVLNYLKGFKEFLSMTETERYKFHNAPSKNAERFMEYLPYAIAFGVEKEWSEVFKDIQVDNPDWYSSSGGASGFNANTFTADISSFTTAFSGSTGTSGSAGSGGSGFSGGGGGGGGGGSW
jgi:uncharacterized membrane protein